MARSARPFPCLRDSPRQRPKCLSLSRTSPRGAEATGHWNKSRSSTKKPCPIPSARLPPSSAPLGVTAPPLPRRVQEKLPPPRRLRAASFSTAARTAPGAGAEGRRRAGGRGREADGRRRRTGRARSPAALPGGGGPPEPDAAEPEDKRRRGELGRWWLRAEAAAGKCRSAGATSRPKTLIWTPSSASSRARVSVCVGVGVLIWSPGSMAAMVGPLC